MNTYQEIVSLENQAMADLKARQLESALLAHGRALQLVEELARPRLMAVIFQRMGEALEANDRVQDAVIAYESGLRALAEEKDMDLMDVLLRMGAIAKGYNRGGPELDNLYNASLAEDLAEAETDPLLVVRLLIFIGNAYLQQPQEKPALNAYDLALNRPEIASAPLLQAYALTNRGAILRRWGKTEAATETLERAVTLFNAHGNPTEKRKAVTLLAGIARDRRLTEKSESLYHQALALYEAADDGQGAGRAYAGLGHLYLQEEDFQRAAPAYEKALELARQSGDDEILAEVYWGLGRCQQAAGNREEAADSFRRSLGQVNARQRDLRTDEGKVSFLESVQRLFDEYIGVLLDLAQENPKRWEEALLAAEDARGRALLNLMEARGRRRPTTGHGVRESRLRPLSEQVQAFENLTHQWAAGLESGEPFDTPAQMAPGLDSAFPFSDEPFSMASQMAAGIPSSDSWSPEGPELLPETETASIQMPPLTRLVFHVLTDRTAVFAVSPAGVVNAHIAPYGAIALADMVAEVRRALGAEQPRGVRRVTDQRSESQLVMKPDSQEELQGVQPVRHLVSPEHASETPADHNPLLQTLYETLIAPLSEALPVGGEPVVIEPHGPLWLLPFAALRTPEGDWLGDRWPVLFAHSAKSLDEIRGEPDYGSPRDLPALILGNPVMPPVSSIDGLQIVLEPLPGAEQEAQQIAALFPEERRELLIGAQATREAVVGTARRYGILHMATHGLASTEDPLASFIALAAAEGESGRLTARQAAGLELPADLVVLSACQTGLGRISGDGMLGLSRSFLAAGARAVLVSQWNVSDAATAALMLAFYKAYLELDNKALALQAAMLTVRRTPGWEHPRFWAPFMVVGAEA